LKVVQMEVLKVVKMEVLMRVVEVWMEVWMGQ
jgi:hypothetical protein